MLTLIQVIATFSVAAAAAGAEALAWKAGSPYQGGDQVTHRGQTYACKPWPYSGWCRLAAYEPGLSRYWSQAWTKIEAAPPSQTEAVPAGCTREVTQDPTLPPVWTSRIYQPNERVRSGGKIYQCKPWPYTAWCSQSAYAPGVSILPGWSAMAWTFVGNETPAVVTTVCPPAPQVDFAALSCSFSYTRPNEGGRSRSIEQDGNPTVEDTILISARFKNAGEKLIELPPEIAHARMTPKLGRYNEYRVSQLVNLFPGEELSVSQRLEPGDATAGAYVFTATADPEQRLSETSETNNQVQCPALTILPAPPKPDLVISDIRLSAAEPTLDEPFTVVVSVLNQGQGRAVFRSDFAMNPKIVESDEAQAAVYTKNVGPEVVFEPGQTRTFILTPQLTWLTAGSHTWNFEVDGDYLPPTINGRVSESDETNNKRSFTFEVHPSVPPTGSRGDLAYEACGFTYTRPGEQYRSRSIEVDGNPTVEDLISVWAKTRNIGDYRIEIQPMNVFARFTPGLGRYPDSRYGATYNIAPGQTESHSMRLEWNTLSPGTYHFTAVADPLGLIEEQREDNNTIECPPLTVLPAPEKPDLVITQVVFSPEQPRVSTPFKALVTVTNRGPGVARFVYDINNPKIVESDQMGSAVYTKQIGQQVVIEPGESRVFELSPQSYARVPGTHSWTFQVDGDYLPPDVNGRVRETDETNNEFTTRITILPD